MSEDSKDKNGLKKSRSLLLTGKFDEDMTKDALNTILDYIGESVEPITIYINSYGGSLDETFAIVDLMEHFKVEGIVFNTICIGKAMSAGSAILLTGTKGCRSITKNARVLIHQLSCGVFGTHAEIKNEVEELNRLQSQLERHCAKNMTCNVVHVRKLMEKNSYLTPVQALKNGIVDKIER